MAAVNIDTLKGIRIYDRSGMLGLIEAFPDQISRANEIGTAFKVPEDLRCEYKNIVCTGLGGSAIGADLLKSYLSGEINIPIFINRHYTLPAFVDKNSLVIVSSYSGNTEETLSAYKDAMANKAKVIAITSGGELEKRARRDGIQVVMVPGGLPPRAALGYSFFPLLILFSKLGLIKDKAKEIDGVVKILADLRREKIGFEVPLKLNLAKRIAGALYDKFPAIYAGQDHIDAVATRWRTQFAENSKTLASTHVFPELCHNEIMGWENPGSALKYFVAIILRDSSDHPRVAKRMDIIKRILGKEKVRVIEVHSSGKDLLERIFSLVYIGDYVSFYLAILNRRDPTSIERIDYLKEQLAKG